MIWEGTTTQMVVKTIFALFVIGLFVWAGPMKFGTRKFWKKD